jgi:hypothetical protein
MANQIKGKVYRILPAEHNEHNGNTYSKQRVIFDCATYDQYTGEPRSNFPSIDFSGKSLETIAQLNVGDMVEVSFGLKGRFYKAKDTGEEKHFTSIEGFRIQKVGQGQAPQSPFAPSPTPDPFAPAPAQAPLPSTAGQADDDTDLPF